MVEFDYTKRLDSSQALSMIEGNVNSFNKTLQRIPKVTMLYRLADSIPSLTFSLFFSDKSTFDCYDKK